jgi:tRNA uridine 5-carboxymethylaminomethyl modification enzyme
VEIEIKYAGYVERQNALIEQTSKMDSLKLAEILDFSLIKGLSHEEKEKLNSIKPRTLGQAQRISGINPSAIQSILVFLKSKEQPTRTS